MKKVVTFTYMVNKQFKKYIFMSKNNILKKLLQFKLIYSKGYKCFKNSKK